MKRNSLTLATCFLAAIVWSCSDNNTHGSETADSTTTTTTTGTDTSATGINPGATTINTTPLGKEDSMFVIEAATGGMMEVEAGNLAQQNGNSQRVKDFGAMMVRDHGQANNELKNLVAGRGVMIPDSLPADKRRHLESMRKMTGKSFDSHYISMMKDDHNQDIKKFERQASSGRDADIKNWASKTLPTLKMHKDSIDAISKAKM
jgi:putative membrane protein